MNPQTLVGSDLSTEALDGLADLPLDDVYTLLKSTSHGLSGEDAACRLTEFGPNALKETKGQPLIVKFLLNFTHLMAILIWVAGIIALIGKMPELAIAVWMVNLINGCFSFWQEFRASKATEALKKMLPSYARVMRDGKELKVLAEELVPGDVVLLEEGDAISVDARVVAANDLRANQSTLTGESRPVRKTLRGVGREGTPRVQQPDLVFAGTTVFAGTGTVVVYATGMDTEFGKIAGMTLGVKDELSPLQKEMNRLTRSITILAISIGVILFVMARVITHIKMGDAFIFAIGMTVAFVPEGLLPTVTLSLALGVQRMVKRHALIKRLSAVETLGSTTVICTDKTGTLTQNEMTVNALWEQGHNLEVTGVGYDAKKGEIVGAGALAPGDLGELLSAAALCCNARLVEPDAEHPAITVLGDPTEAALLVAAEKGGKALAALQSSAPRLRELPFDSDRKRMSTIHQVNGELISYSKGSPKEVLDLCTQQLVDGKLCPLSDKDRAAAMAANDTYARQGLRVLAVAERDLSKVTDLPRAFSEYTPQLIEQDMVFLGLLAMVDPPRQEVARAVQKCHRAGIRIIMVTGDYGLTAESIARKIGIVTGDDVHVITGAELADMDEQTLQEALQGEVIFARVAPEQKLQVVSALQDNNEIVAVTGDGVNDAPALKKADIGVAMGITGTDVAKEAADMILTDDNFASIVGAVEEGRAVYSNIQKFALYVFNSNVSEAVPMITYLFSRAIVPLALGIMQVLAIDLGTDMVPAMGLGAEEPSSAVMDNPPRSRSERIFNKSFLFKAFAWYGMVEATIGMAGFFFVQWMAGWRPGARLAGFAFANNVIYKPEVYAVATTMTFACIVFTQIGVVFGVRSETNSAFSRTMFKNRLILIGIGVEIGLLMLLSYAPFMHGLFHTAPLGITEWLVLICIPFFTLALDEIRKALLRAFLRRRGRAATVVVPAPAGNVQGSEA
ncbi:MAG: cation-transporting P-type ATPase [Coriobacteriia bacterium]|nr:cation-transporting P-type ATPase [Coriobacteriia bacterium]